ncbi:thiamine pyrophosphate-binding protein [Mycobacterium sp. AMU20-3851]|uniref:thiamine pyrophosphate-binding protein n=1 Tax=Mycobacterium sp. AMU20-3851 TaxID=3122055 RepID=UPI0037543B4A
MSHKISGHTALAQAFVDQRVTTAFGVIGEGNIQVLAQLRDNHGVDYVKAAREDGAVLMAGGYAAVTGAVGFASVTHGPGLTNAVTALTHLARRRIPVVVFAGDTDPSLPHGRQRVDQAGIVAPTGAGFQQVYSADAIPDDVARAFGRARAERRPIVLNVPVDVQRHSTTYQPSQVNIGALQAIAPDPVALDVAAGAIADARRPVILAGRGAVLADARTPLTALAARIGAPLATTLCAKDYFRGEPFDLGICGSLSHQVATDTILAADCLIVFGASLNPDTTAEGSLLEGKRIVQVDLESAHLGRHAPVAAAVHADAAQTAVTLVDWFDEVNLPRPGTLCTPELAERLAQHDPRAEFTAQRADLVDSRELTLLLDAVFERERTFVCDSGLFMLAGYSWLHVTEPSAFIETVAFGSIGLGLATAVGAAVGRPDRPTLVTVGDGGLTMGVTELLTAARYGLDMVVVVYNDGAYGAELKITDRIGMGHDLPLLGDVNFAAVAEAMGVPAVRIEGPDQLDRIATALARRTGPLLIDVRTGTPPAH